jgi:hypothetical protein
MVQALNPDPGPAGARVAGVISPHSFKQFFHLNLQLILGQAAMGSVALQKRHDLANDFLVSPTCSDPGCTLGSNTLDLKQPFRRVLDDLEHRLTESAHQPLGKGRSDTFDETRA